MLFVPLKILPSEESGTFTGLSIHQVTCVFLEQARSEPFDLRIGASSETETSSPAEGTKGTGRNSLKVT